MINKTYQEKIENLKKYILDKDFGITLTFEDLNEFIGEDLKEEDGMKRFKNVMRKVRKQLYKNGYVLKGIMNVGYYILKPNQIAGYTYRNFMLKPLNSFYTAQVILDNTKKNKLNIEEKQKHFKTQGLNEALITANSLLINDEDYKELKEEQI